MNTSPSDPAVRSVLRSRALRVLAVYALSFPVGGAIAFYLGLKSIMIPITGWQEPNHTRGDEIVAATAGLAWLANPLFLAGTIALARGSKSWALMLGMSAILFALVASWLAVWTVGPLACYALWISSMGLLLHYANRPVTLPEEDEPVGPRSMPPELPLPSVPSCASDGLARGHRKWAMWVAAGICIISGRFFISTPETQFSGIALIGVAALIIWGAQRLDIRKRADSGGSGRASKVDVDRLLKRYDELE